MQESLSSNSGVGKPFIKIDDDDLDISKQWPRIIHELKFRELITFSEHNLISGSLAVYFIQNDSDNDLISLNNDYAFCRSIIEVELKTVFDNISTALNMESISRSYILDLLNISENIRNLYSSACSSDSVNVRKSANGLFIKVKETLESISPALREKFNKVNSFFYNNPDGDASTILVELFPEILESDKLSASSRLDAQRDILKLPDRAPKLWSEDKLPGDNPISFIKRHYSPWLGRNLTRPDVKRLDTQLYTALANWLRRNEMPDDVYLPTLKQTNDQLAERLMSGDQPILGEMTAREVGRLNSIMQRRRGQERQ